MKLTSISLALILAVSASAPAISADKKKPKAAKKDQTLSSIIKEKTETKGLLNFYQDKKTGEMLMLLNKEQLGSPMLYFAHTVDGVADAGHFRGGYREAKTIEFRRYFNRIDIITKTPRFLFDDNNAISRAKEANISEAVLASLPIKKEENGQILLNVNKLFLSEALHKISPWKRPGDKNAHKRFNLGKLNSKQSRFVENRSFDHNVDVVIDYVFKNANPSVSGSKAISDPRSTSVKVQHSFVKLPDNNFKPRLDDARIGYFNTQYDEMTSSKWAPYRDIIHRWNLVKKDPAAAISEPVQPIVWWIENTTPLAWRDTIKEAVLSWNSSFEQAGFKNAIVVKVQPDDAKWSAGDINYNVLRWTASPSPRFGGYGPSLANPLTGEILGADIMLEFVFMKNRWIYDSLYSQGANSLNLAATDNQQALHCSAGHQVQQGLLMANTMADTDAVEDNPLLTQALRSLILHEVGHTLGLNHNMKSSILWDEKEVHDSTLTQGILAGSVMDYTPINIAPKGIKQGDYFQTKPGPYDDWAIEYGYSMALTDTSLEAQRLDAILSRSSEPAHTFGNDADDMRRPGWHIDPRIMIGDMSSNPVAYASQRMALIDELLLNLKQKTLKQGASYQQLLISANSLFGQYRTQADIISRQIGGIYIERDFYQQSQQNTPYTPVPKATQQAAMDTLAKQVFNSDVLENMAPLYNYMQHQRRGFNHFTTNEDPRVHDMILKMQTGVLTQLLHPKVLKRISDSSLYGNQYSLTQVMNDLSAAIFDSGRLTTISQNIQTHYVKRLIAILGASGKSPYDNLAKAAALGQLNAIYDRITTFSFGKSEMTKHHHAYIKLLIDNAINH